jgi:hypothetical protein
MDIGRNDPCPCGSGKKYKRCCGAPRTDPIASAAHEIRAAQESAQAKVKRFLRDELEDNAMDNAWEEFDLSEDGLDPRRDETELFVPWVLYDWEPWEAAKEGKRPRYARLSPAWVAQVERQDAFSPAESDFLISVLMTPTSFHEVLSTEPGRTLTLRDIMLESELTVLDSRASSDVQPGDIIYARLVPFADVTLFVGSGQLVIPPKFKGFILDTRKQLRPRLRKLTGEKLCQDETVLRAVYFDVRGAIVNPPRPEMQNTDGDPMEFHTLTYKLASVEAAIVALAPLAGEAPEDLLAEANRARPGGSKRVTFSWTCPGNPKHGGMSNTVLADFKVNGATLTVEVNSENRAKSVKIEIAKRLEEGATLVRDDRVPMDHALRAAATKPESKRERAARQRDEELQALPEIQAMIGKMTADHYSTWPDVPLPALKGKTPRVAMKTREGRERVEALVVDFERQQSAGRVPPYDFNQLREMLGLPLRGNRATPESSQ